MLYRSAWEKLEQWKNKKGHHPLVIRGLRQTGKTFLVREFGKAHYPHVVYLDLRANRSVRDAFSGDFQVDRMVLAITASETTARFVPHKTLLILDEIQDCPDARSSLKYWAMDGRYDVIATGSFLGVKGFREPYVRGIPVGYEESLVLYPMTFTEFLKNAGISDDVVRHAKASIEKGEPVMKVVHQSLRTMYLQYLIVGGMPEAVRVFRESHDVNAVRDVQRNILTSIRDDFGRYKDANGEDKVNETLKLRAEACLDSLPAQLAKDYKKFQYSLVQARGHSTEKADGLQYLTDVGLVIKAHNVREISAPLEGVKIPTEFKVYYTDTGLLLSQMEEEIAPRVLAGDLSSYKGALAENMIASALYHQGRKVYYLHAPSGSPELDFIISYRGEPTIVECKATNNRVTSMRYVLTHPKKYGVHPAIKYADTNVGRGEHYVTRPLYAAGFLGESDETGTL